MEAVEYYVIEKFDDDKYDVSMERASKDRKRVLPPRHKILKSVSAEAAFTFVRKHSPGGSHTRDIIDVYISSPVREFIYDAIFES